MERPDSVEVCLIKGEIKSPQAGESLVGGDRSRDIQDLEGRQQVSASCWGMPNCLGFTVQKKPEESDTLGGGELRILWV